MKKIGEVYSNPKNIGGNGRGTVYDTNGFCATITTMSGGGNKPMIIDKRNKIMQIGNLIDNQQGFGNPQVGSVYSAEGISPTLNTCQGGYNLKWWL